MIAIDTRIQPFEGQEIEADKNYQNIFLSESQPDLVAFMQECLDQELVLNSAGYSAQENYYNFDDHGIIRYYAIDLEKAESFIAKLTDMSANFSVKKFWAENKFNFFVEHSTVNFDAEHIAFEVVDASTSQVWGTNFPNHQIAYYGSINHKVEVDNK